MEPAVKRRTAVAIKYVIFLFSAVPKIYSVHFKSLEKSFDNRSFLKFTQSGDFFFKLDTEFGLNQLFKAVGQKPDII